MLDRITTSLSTSKNGSMVNRLTEEGDMEGRKMALTQIGSNCPFGINTPYIGGCTYLSSSFVFFHSSHGFELLAWK
jgi:hypothetical protein